jgi:hypothetical protein
MAETNHALDAARLIVGYASLQAMMLVSSAFYSRMTTGSSGTIWIYWKIYTGMLDDGTLAARE